MDVPPPWYELSTDACLGDQRRCAVGDDACEQRAEKDGYVAISYHDFCRKDDIHTVPMPAGALLLVALVALGGVALWRMRRRLGHRRER